MALHHQIVAAFAAWFVFVLDILMSFALNRMYHC